MEEPVRHARRTRLQDRPSVPRSSPTQTPPDVVERIEQLRRDNKWSARRITLELANQGVRISERTVGRWLARLGINHRRFLDPDGSANRRPTKRIVARYPGHRVHLDVKKVGRIPDGGGWRAHGRGSEQTRAAQRTKTGGTKSGYVYLHSAVDGFSRLAYTEPLPDEKAATTVAFLSRARAFFAAHGIHRVVRVVTDNGANYRAAVFVRSLNLVGLPPPADQALHAPAQRQGRALPAHPRRRTPLRQAVDL